MGLPMYEDSSGDEKQKNTTRSDRSAAARRSPIRRTSTVHGPVSRNQNSTRGSARGSARGSDQVTAALLRDPSYDNDLNLLTTTQNAVQSDIYRSALRRHRLARSRGQRGSSGERTSAGAPSPPVDPAVTEAQLSIPTPPHSFEYLPVTYIGQPIPPPSRPRPEDGHRTPARYEVDISVQQLFSRNAVSRRATLQNALPGLDYISDSARERPTIQTAVTGSESEGEVDSWDTLLTTIEPDRHLPSTQSSFTTATASATASQSTRPSASSNATSPSTSSESSRLMSANPTMPTSIDDPLYDCLSGQARVIMTQMLALCGRNRSVPLTGELTTQQQLLAVTVEDCALRCVFDGVRAVNTNILSLRVGDGPTGELLDGPDLSWPPLPRTSPNAPAGGWTYGYRFGSVLAANEGVTDPNGLFSRA